MPGCRWRVVFGLAALALLAQIVFIAAPDAGAAGPSDRPSLTFTRPDGTEYALNAGEKGTLGYVPGQVIVEFAAGTTVAAMDQTAVTAGAETLHASAAAPAGALRLSRGIAYSVVKSRSLTVPQLVTRFRAMKGVVAVSPNYIRKAFGTPNDPKFSLQWGLRNTGQGGGKSGADIDAATAWGYSTGSRDVVLADIDTGVFYTHPDLAANMWRNPGEVPGDGLDNDRNGYVDDVYGIDEADGDSDPMDDHGHGTHTSGIMAAAGNNGVGVAGVDWKAKVMALRFLDSNGYGDDAGAIRCIEYLLDMKERGVNVVAINASWGGWDEDLVLKDAIAATGDAGIVWCAAAGNLGVDIDTMLPEYPASWDLPNIVSVAATDRWDRLAEWSNYGKVAVDLAAPGAEIMSTIPDFTKGPALFSDNMESGAGKWTVDAPWAITAELAKSPTHSWADSPGGDYANNMDRRLTSQVIDASHTHGPVMLTFQAEIVMDGMSDDYMALELSPDGGASWEEFGELGGSGGEGEWYLVQANVSEEFLTDQFRFRFRFRTDGSGTAAGVHIDDVRVAEAVGGYEAWDGTSMATPFVTGTVGLMAAISPTTSVDGRVDALLGTVDPLSTLRNKCVTGGRLDAGAATKWVKLAPVATVETVAGKTGVPGRADGTGAAARFYYPQGVCADPSTGILYVVDWNNHTVRKVTMSGLVTTLAGAPGKPGAADGTGAAARFDSPCGICFDPVDNALYVADRGNNVIRRVTRAGVVTTVAGLAGQAGSADGTGSQARFDRPTGICFDLADGNLYITDQGNATVRRVSPAGVVRTIAGRPGTPGTGDGGRSTGRLDSPAGICYDPVDGNLYVTESRMNTVRRVTPAGALTTIAGSPGAAGRSNGTGKAARFSSPVDICYNPGDQKLYVADSGNQLIRQVTASGVVRTFVGIAGYAKSVDGQGSEARLCYPRNLCYNPANGRLYFTEDAMVLRRISFGQQRDAAPVVSLGSAVSIVNGVPFTRTARFTDSGSVSWTASVDYGDGSGTRPLAVASGKTLPLSHTWQRPGSYTVRVSVWDDAGMAGVATLAVVVTNRAPAIKAGKAGVAWDEHPFTQAGSFSDTGAGPWTATVDYGDRTGTKSLALRADKSFTLSHTYRTPGVFTVRVTVNDGFATGTDTLLVGVASRHQQSNVNLVYAGPWKTVPASAASAGSYKEVNASGGVVTVRFSGRSVDLVGRMGRDRGIARVTLDGGAPILVDLYAAANAFQKTIWSSGFLSQGDHTVRVEWTGRKNAGATGTAIDLDALWVVGALR